MPIHAHVHTHKPFPKGVSGWVAMRAHTHTHTRRDVGTWGQQTDGHEQHVFLLVKVEVLQAHLELHQWLQQLQRVAGYGGNPRGPFSFPLLIIP